MSANFPSLLATRLRSHRRRAGSAPLELVLVAPLLFFMFILVLWVGNFMIGQATVVAKARNDAWHKRFTEAESKAYDFGDTGGYVEAKATQERRISNLVSAFPNPKSRHQVLGDAWYARSNDASPAAQQRQTELNSHWNVKLQLELAKHAGVNIGGDFLGQLTSLQNMGDNIRNVIEQKVNEKLGPIKDLFDQFKGQADAKKRELEERREAERKKLADEVEALKAEIERLKAEVKAKKDRLKEIEEQLKASEDAEDGDEDKLTEAEVKQLEAEQKKIEDVDLPKLEKELDAKQKELSLKQMLLNQFSRS